MTWIRKLLSLVLVLVVAGNVAMPAMAAEIERDSACPTYLELTSGNSKVAVVEINGIEKSEILAKVLKNKDIKKLRTMLAIKGYKVELTEAKVIEVIDRMGIAKTVVIPAKSDTGRLMLVYITTEKFTKVGAVEILDYNKSIKIYYVENERVKSYTTKSWNGDCWACIRDCTVECLAQKCTPSSGYIVPSECDICWHLVRGCAIAPAPENPSCVGMAICFGAIATGCFCWCTYHCNKDLGRCP